MSSRSIHQAAVLTVCLTLSWGASALRADASGIVSDDFNACALNTALWTVVNPLGDSAVFVTGVGTNDARLILSVPAGVPHDVWTDNDNAVRVLQPANDTDFEIQVKLDSQFTKGIQVNGLLVEQDATHLLRYDYEYNGVQAFLASATIAGSQATVGALQAVANTTPFWLAIQRVGSQWTLRFSTDGQNWTDFTSFSYALTVTSVGVFAGNFGAPGSPPAFTAKIDYFLNTASPFVTEDGVPPGLTGHALTRAVTGQGSVAVNPDQNAYYCNETVTVTAVPDAGWQFTGWSGDSTSTSNPIQLVMDTDKSITATFIQQQQTGSLQVTLSPQDAITAGAQWNVDGGAWQDSGAVVSGLTVGSHTVSFKDVAAWTKPGDQAVDVVANATATASGTYTAVVPQTGSLQVTLSPQDAITAGAQWNVDGGAWQDGGAVVAGLTVGSHTVSFKDVAAWTKPGDQAVDVVANATATASGTYTAVVPQTGSLQVTLSPQDAITAGAQWNVDGGAWQDSGAVVSGLTVGSHTVSFKDVAAWTKPGDQAVDVVANATATASGTYTAVVPQTGSLQVTLSPQDAITAGAQWNVDGGAWQDSGAVVAGLTVGSHTVSFKDVAAWTKPGDQAVSIVANQMATASGTYTASGGGGGGGGGGGTPPDPSQDQEATDASGAAELAVTTSGASAQVSISGAPPNVEVKASLTANVTNHGFAGIGAGDGAGVVGRKVVVEASLAPGAFAATIQICYAQATLDAAHLHVSDLAVYTWNTTENKWVLAGTSNIGQSQPTGKVGDFGWSGNCVWVVVDHFSEFLAADGCPDDPNKSEPGVCGCGIPDTDSDNDGVPDCKDGCPNDPSKTTPGICGCGVADTDSDGDGVPDCTDGCPNDPSKTAPGVCGCGVADADSDGDGVPDCHDGCPNDPNKTAPGTCGCGVADTDSDGDGAPDCHDGCPNDPNKTAPGVCGCGVADTDSDGDGVPDCHDGCPNDPNKTAPGACGCGVADTDSDGDGAPDCQDGCPNDPNKTAPGVCGCGVADTDSDGDGVPDCQDGCPNDPNKTTPGTCGCGVPDTDSDGDGVPDCIDNCPNVANPDQTDTVGDGVGDACRPPAPVPATSATGRTAPPAGLCGVGVAESGLCTLMCLLAVQLRRRSY